MVHSMVPRLEVRFFRTARGREPVREWLRSLDRDAKKRIGEDIKKVQFSWPVGMPLVRGMGDGIWEVRSQLRTGIARILFICQWKKMILLHGYHKKNRTTPKSDLELAKWRAVEVRQGDLF